MFNTELKKLRMEHGWTQEKLAQLIGVKKNTISMYETGKRKPDIETLECIADIFNVDINRFATQPKYASNIFPLPDTKTVPLLGKIACGSPVLADENIEDYIKVDNKIPADFALRCVGDSMINARIFDGDIVFIRQQPEVEDGEIAAVQIGDEATLKRVYHYPEKLILAPCNPVYDDFVYRDEQLANIRILGKAVAFLSLIRK